MIQLPPLPRGCHVITPQIKQQMPDLKDFRIGLAHLFVLVGGGRLARLAVFLHERHPFAPWT